MAKSLETLFKEALKEPVVREDGGSVSRRDAIVLAVIEKAMKGDLPSVNFIRELTEKYGRKKKETEEVVRVKVIDA